MTISTTNVRFRNCSFRFLAVSRNLDTPLEECRKRADHGGAQLHKLAGVGQRDGGDGAGKAQVARPFLVGSAQQPAFFLIAATVVVAIKPGTFFSGRCFHKIWAVDTTCMSGWRQPPRPPFRTNVHDLPPATAHRGATAGAAPTWTPTAKCLRFGRNTVSRVERSKAGDARHRTGLPVGRWLSAVRS